MDAATLVRHALEALRKPLTLKEALSSVTDFRIGRKKKHPLYEILMAAVCAMIDGAKGPTSGALRAKCPSSRQSAIQRPAGGGRETLSSLAAALLAAGCWSTSAAGRPMAEVGHGRHGGHNIHRRQAPQARPHEGLQDALHRQRPLEPHEARDRAGQGRREIQRDNRHPRAPGPSVPQRGDRDDRRAPAGRRTTSAGSRTRTSGRG